MTPMKVYGCSKLKEVASKSFDFVTL